MMSAISILLPLLAKIAPTLGSPAITTVITGLAEAVPALVQLGTDVTPLVKNIIGAVRSNENVTDEQLADLDALEAQYDADFEAAAAAAEAEDAAFAAKT